MKGPWTEKVEKWWADFSPNIKIVWETTWSWVWGHWVEIAVVLIVLFGIWGLILDYIDPVQQMRRKTQWQKTKQAWRGQSKDPNVNGNTETAQEDRDSSRSWLLHFQRKS